MSSAVAKAKRRVAAAENGGSGDVAIDPGLLTLIQNGEDLGPLARQAFEIGKPDVLLQQLRHMVKKKEVEIEELCKLHYEDFIVAVDELRGVLVDADELKHSLSAENGRLQDIASSLLIKLEELLESYAIRKNIGEALRTLKACVQALQLCAKCNALVSASQFYPALKTLDLIQNRYLASVPVRALRRAIEHHIPAIKTHIEKRVCSQFNDWLVHIRGRAKELGHLAIAQAASARQKDEELRARQREAEEQCRLGGGSVGGGTGGGASPSPTFIPSALCSYSLNEDAGSQDEEDPALQFDLTSVYRAYHIYTCLGLQERFRSYYYDNRMMQMNLDLQISSAQPFLESHQTFFALIAGHFVVEDRVFRTSAGLLSDTQVEAIWESAITKVNSVLEVQFASVDTASHLLLIKDNVTLLAATLRRYGYQVSSLLELLDRSRDKYHKLLITECRKQITDALTNDSYEQLIIRKEYEYSMNVLAFNLHTSAVTPPFPFIAPFSSSVPDICRIVRSFIEDSVSYLSYGGLMNLYDAVKKYLDKLLIEVLNDALLNTIHGGVLGVAQAMQISANVAVLEQVCDVFLQHAAQLCGLPTRVVERPHAGLAAKHLLRATESASYNALLSLICSKVDEYMSLTTNVNWIADDPPPSGNDYITEVTGFLETIFTASQQILPLEALNKIATGVMEHISDSIVGTFLSDAVKRFTLSAVIGVDHDLKNLELFAEERFLSTGLCDIKKDGDLRDCLIEARQLVNLLLSNQPENFMNPVIRQKSYGTLDYRKVANVCEKFKDSPDRLFGSLSNRNTKQNARKKSMDMLKRRLKECN